MENKNFWMFVNWSILVVVILAAVWMIWGLPQSEVAPVGEVGLPVEECVDVEELEGITYEACYDAFSEMIFLKMNRENVNYQINEANVFFVGLVSQSYDFSNIPLAGENGAYKLASKKNPRSINVKLDVVQSSSEFFCGSKRVFVDYCPVGTGGTGVDASISSIEGVSVGDFVEVKDAPDFEDFDSDVIVLDLADKEKVWASQCSSNWECEDFGACEDGVKRRDCVDLNSCFVSTNSPARTKGCDGSCIEDWSCEWSECRDGKSVPSCSDANRCGTSYDVPEELSCGESGACVPNVVCEAWTECGVDYDFEDLVGVEEVSHINGSKTRLCVDETGCAPAKKETQVCSVGVDIYTKTFERCGEEYTAIYNVLGDETLAILKEGSEEDTSLNIYFDDRESVYCDYCFDGVINGDEEDVDCGGSCRKCKTESYFYEEKHWWDFFFDF